MKVAPSVRRRGEGAAGMAGRVGEVTDEDVAVGDAVGVAVDDAGGEGGETDVDMRRGFYGITPASGKARSARLRCAL
jgi:hypothetical protein